MEINKILQSDYLDLIYENRNKKYGGYELRKHYNGRALKALSITCGLILLGIGTPFLVSKLHAKETIAINEKKGEVTAVIREIELPDKPKTPDAPKPKVQTAAPPPVAATIKNPPPVIVKNNDVPPALKPPEVKELIDKVSGPVNNVGQGGTEMATSDKLNKGPFGGGNTPGVDKDGGGSLKNDQPVKFAEEMPEFPGGMKALIAFIQRNLHYPAAARENNIEGRVVVSFVVNTQGGIEGAKIERSVAGGCDKEALRVVNSMPKWKPGKQNGHAVKVYYTLPISFKLEK